MLDEDYGDITDPIEGRDVKVVCSKQPGMRWAMTEVRPRGKQSPLSETASQSTNWTSNIPDVSDMFQCKSYDELAKIINDWLNDDYSDSAGSDHGTSGSSTKAESTSSGNASGYKNLDDAFADLMDD